MQILIEFDDARMIRESRQGEIIVFAIGWEHDGELYPGDNWWDNGLILMGWWFRALDNLLAGMHEETIMFMEGSCSFTVTQNKPGTVKMVSQEQEVEWHVTIQEFGDAILDGASTILKKLEMLGIETEAQAFLRRGIERLGAKAAWRR